MRSFKPNGHELRQLLHGLVVGLITAACGVALIMSPFGPSLERTFGLNWLFKIRGAIPQPAGLAIVGINGRTGPALGLPKAPHHWSRMIHASLIERLIEKNPEVIVFDVDFSRTKSTEEDASFAGAIAKANRVVLFEWLTARRERVFATEGIDVGWVWIEERQPPTEALALAARALGPFPLPKEGQATLEFWAFKPSTGGAPTTVAVALQLKALTSYNEWLTVLKMARASGISDLPAHAGDLTRPANLEQLMKKLRRMFQQDSSLRQRLERVLDNAGGVDAGTRRLLAALAALYAGPDHYFLNLYGPPGTIRTIPYESFLAEKVGAAPDDLTNDVVFVGYSDLYDPQQPDRYYTSFTGEDGIDLSGVEIMATAYANLLQQNMLRPADPLTTAIFVLLFGLLAGILAYLLPPAVAVPTAVTLTGLYTALIQWRFNETDLWLPLAAPALVQLPLALLIGLMGQYLLERRKEKQVSRALGHYIPESLIRDLTERQVDPTTVDRVQFGTCLATDMSGFAALGELKSPQQLAVFLNEYFDALADALKRHDVDVMEFRADMIMCAWIAPVPSPIICQKGTDAAIELSEIIGKYADAHGSVFKPRVGLQDGPVYVGHTGGGGHLVYSVQGHAANTAARLESLNRHLGTQVLAAESVIKDADGLLLRPLGLFQLSGNTSLTSVIEIHGRSASANAEQVELCAQFADGLAAFQKKDWPRAVNIFEAITKRASDGPSKFYLDISRKYAVDTPVFGDLAYVQLSEK